MAAIGGPSWKINGYLGSCVKWLHILSISNGLFKMLSHLLTIIVDLINFQPIRVFAYAN